MSGLILISLWILTINKFLDFNGAQVCLKIFRNVIVFYVKYRQELQIRAQLKTDTIYKKGVPTRLYYCLRIELVIFMARGFHQVFVKILWTS